MIGHLEAAKLSLIMVIAFKEEALEKSKSHWWLIKLKIG